MNGTGVGNGESTQKLREHGEQVQCGVVCVCVCVCVCVRVQFANADRLTFKCKLFGHSPNNFHHKNNNNQKQQPIVYHACV